MWVYGTFSVFCLIFIFGIDGYSFRTSRIGNHERDVQVSPTCVSCVAVVKTMKLIIKWDKSEPAVLELATFICKLFADQSWTVCNGLSGQFREEIFYVLRNLESYSSSMVCGLLLPECDDPGATRASNWEVSLPPKPKRKRMKKIKEPTFNRPLNVLQLTDIHLDFQYSPNTEADCLLPICCHERVAHPKQAAGFWGTVGKCDIPYHTVEKMLQHINTTHEIDYILLSGDFINHVDWAYTIEDHQNTLRNISALVRRFFPTTPTYWALGNHEGVPVNSFAPHFVNERFWPTWLYEELLEMSQPWLDAETLETILFRGSYSTRVKTGLRLISLNTGFCETTNFFLYLNQSDPDGTMSWLVKELYKAEMTGEFVQILAHIPPGDGECLEGWARNYYRVVQRFSSTIVGQFFGHVHLDYFTVYYSNMHKISSKPIGVSYSAPSVTTFANLNPGYRIYKIDSEDSFKIIDFDNYFADLSLTNITTPPEWKLQYSAKNEYGMQDLSPVSWNQLVDRITKDKELQNIFVRNAHRVLVPDCDFVCRRNLLCGLRMGHHNETLYCPKLTNISKPFLFTNLTPK